MGGRLQTGLDVSVTKYCPLGGVVLVCIKILDQTLVVQHILLTCIMPVWWAYSGDALKVTSIYQLISGSRQEEFSALHAQFIFTHGSFWTCTISHHTLLREIPSIMLCWQNTHKPNVVVYMCW